MATRPKAPSGDKKGGSVVALHPERLSIAEQQMLARRAARRDIPTKQRDFSEVWGKEQPRRTRKSA
jgi:hypothetical protein